MLNDKKSTPNANIPFAHIIHSSAVTDVLTCVLNKLATHIGEDLVPKFVLVDDCDAEIAAVEASTWGIKGCKVALCIWHAKSAWLLKIIKMFPGKENYAKRIEVFTALEELQSIEAR